MSGEPEIGVQHRPEHFHGVAANRQVMRHNERDKPNRRTGDSANAVAGKTLEDNPEQRGAPADEHGGGVEVGHRGAALQGDAKAQARGLQHKSQDG